jgi:competence protein ComEA
VPRAPLVIVLGLSSLLDPGPIARAAKAIDGVVNLNTAPPEVLGLLPGIGPAKAAEIVVYRKKRPFRTVDELVRIKGIGRKMVRRLRNHLAVAGPTTATALAGRAPPPPEPPHLHAPPAGTAPARSPPPRPLCPPPRPVARAKPRWPTHGACPRPA